MTRVQGVRLCGYQIMSKNVIQGLFRYKSRLKKDLKEKKLRCDISDRWIQFPQASEICSEEIDYLRLNIMTTDINDNERKLCELLVDRSALTKILTEIPSIDYRDTENE